MTCPTPEQFKAVRARFNLADMEHGKSAFQIEYSGDNRKMIAATKNESEILAIFTASASDPVAEFICFAIQDMRDALTVIDTLNERNAALRKKIKGDDENKKNAAHYYSRASAIMCAKYDFRKFLHTQHGLKEWTNDTAIATRLRSLLNIKSRKELDTDQAARNRWFKLVEEFEAFNKHTRQMADK